MAKSRQAYGRGTGNPHPVDVHVGARVRVRRTLLGINQTKLGEALGMSFQQVQKYERGTNRIGAGRLYDLARVLDMSIDYFFEDMPPKVAASPQATKGRSRAKKQPSYRLDPMAKRETLEFVHAYYKIEDANVRKQVYAMTKTLGAGVGN